MNKVKKGVALILVVFIATLFSTAVVSAEHRQNWSHSAYKNGHWRYKEHRADESLPFRWHERRGHYYGERIYDRGWGDRFPGLHPYRWHDQEFWYRGCRVTDAVLFYNDSDELVSVGFMHNGVFIFIRDDHEGYENHDSFFLSWWSRH